MDDVKSAKKEVSKNIGKSVREIREGQEISQEKLADLCELHRTYIGALERGENNITLFNLIRVARALNLTASEVLNRAGY